jgi:hypothetical protein
VEQQGYKDLSLYFDKATGLPARADIPFKIKKNGDETTVSLLFSDYKEIDGVKHSTKITVPPEPQKTLMEV